MKPHVLTHKVSQLLAAHQLRPGAQPMLCGLSGGADSVALVMVLCDLGYPVVALHCNFQLRGEESERDERFVADFCAARSIPLRTVRFDTRTEAARHGESIEMAARRLRYDWFRAIADETGGHVCVAHHADDNVETMLLNLLRGSGLHGLTGMRFKNDFGVLRPMLEATRADIVDFLATRGQSYVTDSTNTDTHYRRNMVRHELLPILRSINPAIDATLIATMARLREAETLIDTLGDTTMQQRRTLMGHGFSMAQIVQMETARNGAYVTAGEMMLTRHGDQLIVGRIPAVVPTTPLTPGTTTAVRAASVSASGATGPDSHAAIALSVTSVPRSGMGDLRCPTRACLDSAAVSGQLRVRSVQSGDRFTPYGMRGSKLVSDYLTDRKRSRLEKQAALAVCDDKGIVWLVGETIDRRVAVTAATAQVLVVEIVAPE